MKVRVLLAALALAGCSSLGEDELFSADPLPDAAPDPDAEVPVDPTLDAIHARIFEPLCSCHFAAVPAGALNFRKEFIYTELVDRTSSCNGDYTRVIASDPANSFLFVKLAAFTDGAALDCGTPMPQSDTPLSSLQLDAIEQWIADGAPNFENP